ncbi:hypothetical protein BKA66DRAFT_442737 [Pyrenochaeta sp. MPI-SDFR-AT-0127]|nr:hypothetical protein BKA66DRAFT_442737 [Pyrenochaeta sp. MPI-SDFR-AT-0127]
MVLIRFASALAAASILALAAADTASSATPTVKNPLTTPTVTLPASQIVNIGCFETGTPLEDHGPYVFQSPGNCQLVCIEQGKNVFGMSDGSNCYCGDKLPAKEWQIDNSTCDTSCGGEKNYDCGGPGVLWVALTGVTRNRVDNYVPDPSASSTKPSSAGPTSASKSTATSTPTAAPKGDSKPNTIAIAVGVVVGILGLAALLFGIWFLLRRRRQRQAEEDYRRNAANVSSFVNGGKLHTSNSSMNDSRLDPSFVDRRQSNGSIADNEDYSRRILKVTNV